MGVERQACNARRHARRHPDRPRLLGRAGDQRPALLLPAHPPRHAPHSLRIFIGFASPSPARPPPRHAHGPTSSRRPRRSPSASPPSRFRAEGTPEWLVPHPRLFQGNRPSNILLADALTPAVLGQLGRPLRALRLHPREPSGTSTASTSGAWNSARSSPQKSSPNWNPPPNPPPRTTPQPPPHPPLPRQQVAKKDRRITHCCGGSGL